MYNWLLCLKVRCTQGRVLYEQMSCGYRLHCKQWLISRLLRDELKGVCRRLSEDEAAASKDALENVEPDSATIQAIMQAFVSGSGEAGATAGKVSGLVDNSQPLHCHYMYPSSTFSLKYAFATCILSAQVTDELPTDNVA